MSDPKELKKKARSRALREQQRGASGFKVHDGDLWTGSGYRPKTTTLQHANRRRTPTPGQASVKELTSLLRTRKLTPADVEALVAASKDPKARAQLRALVEEGRLPEFEERLVAELSRHSESLKTLEEQLAVLSTKGQNSKPRSARLRSTTYEGYSRKKLRAMMQIIPCVTKVNERDKYYSPWTEVELRERKDVHEKNLPVFDELRVVYGNQVQLLQTLALKYDLKRDQQKRDHEKLRPISKAAKKKLRAAMEWVKKFNHNWDRSDPTLERFEPLRVAQNDPAVILLPGPKRVVKLLPPSSPKKPDQPGSRGTGVQISTPLYPSFFVSTSKPTRRTIYN